jgi:hypothetical protein
MTAAQARCAGAALCNFCGSVTFLAAPCFYYAVEAAKDDEVQAAVLTTWGLKFMYLVGSIAFAIGAACGVLEVLQDTSSTTHVNILPPSKFFGEGR